MKGYDGKVEKGRERGDGEESTVTSEVWESGRKNMGVIELRSQGVKESQKVFIAFK